ncbi:sugar kinase [Desemzia incerta]|uniref:sugar kinase n=1 Tax=Desemzia incerta TaxID=82801 RepID=UPI000AEFF834|nr:sugar kinase [Desemzia incerta]
MARLGFEVDFLTKLGKDPFGQYIYKYLQNERIGTEHITFDEELNTGIMLKNKTKEGDPITAYYRKGSAFTNFSIEDVMDIDFSEVRLLHVTGIPPAVNRVTRGAVYHLMAKAREAGSFITFDPNMRPELWKNEETMIKVLNNMARYANVVLPGISEGEKLTGSRDKETIAQFYLDMGVEYVVIKTGSDGAFIRKQGQEMKNVPGFTVKEVVDTVGAGDGFAVGVISAYLDGLDMENSVLRGNAIGSLQVQNQGDNEGLPSRDELEKYIQENNPLN